MIQSVWVQIQSYQYRVNTKLVVSGCNKC